MKLYIYMKLVKENMERERYAHLCTYMDAHESTTLWFPLCTCKGQAVLLPASLALRLVLETNRQINTSQIKLRK